MPIQGKKCCVGCARYKELKKIHRFEGKGVLVLSSVFIPQDTFAVVVSIPTSKAIYELPEEFESEELAYEFMCNQDEVSLAAAYEYLYH